MAKYKFSWSNLPASLLRALTKELELEGDAHDALRRSYGARPKATFVQDAWPVLRERWLAKDREARQLVVEALLANRVGDRTIAVNTATGQLEYLRSCRNGATLRQVVLDAFIAAGEKAPAPSPAAATAPGQRSARSRSWAPYEATLAATLGALTEDQFLVLELADRPGFVQFAALGVNGLRAELVSNAFLPPKHQLSEQAMAQAVRLGWLAPTGTPEEVMPDQSPDGSPNFYRDWPVPVPYVEVARLVVDTLVNVLGVRHPSQLRYRAFTGEGAPIVLPMLGQRARDDDEAEEAPAGDGRPVEDLVLETLRESTGNPDLQRDDDGDVPLRFGSSAVFVRVFGDPPVIRAYAPVLAKAQTGAKLNATLNDMNRDSAFVKWLASDDTVIAVIDVFGRPYDATHVLLACEVVGASADNSDEKLQEQFGGQTFFGEYAPPKLPRESYGYL